MLASDWSAACQREGLGRGGQLNDASFGSRMTGQGVLAEQIRRMFEVFAAKYDLSGELPPLDTSHFRRPRDLGQRRLF